MSESSKKRPPSTKKPMRRPQIWPSRKRQVDPTRKDREAAPSAPEAPVNPGKRPSPRDPSRRRHYMVNGLDGTSKVRVQISLDRVGPINVAFHVTIVGAADSAQSVARELEERLSDSGVGGRVVAQRIARVPGSRMASARTPARARRGMGAGGRSGTSGGVQVAPATKSGKPQNAPSSRQLRIDMRVVGPREQGRISVDSAIGLMFGDLD